MPTARTARTEQWLEHQDEAADAMLIAIEVLCESVEAIHFVPVDKDTLDELHEDVMSITARLVNSVCDWHEFASRGAAS